MHVLDFVSTCFFVGPVSEEAGHPAQGGGGRVARSLDGTQEAPHLRAGQRDLRAPASHREVTQSSGRGGRISPLSDSKELY